MPWTVGPTHITEGLVSLVVESTRTVKGQRPFEDGDP